MRSQQSDWQAIIDGLQRINPQTPIEVAIVVARTAAVMGNPAITITAELEAHLTAANVEIAELKEKVWGRWLETEAKPIKRFRKRGKR